MSEGKIRCIIKRPDEPVGHVTNISASLENLQRIVGGYIETVTYCTDLVIICNEEGRLLGLPYNCNIAGVDYVGDIIAIGTDGEEFSDLKLSFNDWKQYWLGVEE